MNEFQPKDEESSKKPYDLESRTELFAKRVRVFVKRLPRTICNYEDVRQLVRSSGAIGANYIEANESLGKKDFLMHIKVSRKEAKESRYWLSLVDTDSQPDLESERAALRANEHIRRHIAEVTVGFPNSNFEFVSDFEIRVSDF